MTSVLTTGSLYWSSQHPINRETGYRNVLGGIRILLKLGKKWYWCSLSQVCFPKINKFMKSLPHIFQKRGGVLFCVSFAHYPFSLAQYNAKDLIQHGSKNLLNLTKLKMCNFVTCSGRKEEFCWDPVLKDWMANGGMFEWGGQTGGQCNLSS